MASDVTHRLLRLNERRKRGEEEMEMSTREMRGTLTYWEGQIELLTSSLTSTSTNFNNFTSIKLKFLNSYFDKLKKSFQTYIDLVIPDIQEVDSELEHILDDNSDTDCSYYSDSEDE